MNRHIRMVTRPAAGPPALTQELLPLLLQLLQCGGAQHEARAKAIPQPHATPYPQVQASDAQALHSTPKARGGACCRCKEGTQGTADAGCCRAHPGQATCIKRGC
jgi:hypothetical protein